MQQEVIPVNLAYETLISLQNSVLFDDDEKHGNSETNSEFQWNHAHLMTKYQKKLQKLKIQNYN